MTTFKEIRGTTIEVVSTDPANPEIGQIWYNSSSGTLKGYRTVNAWSSGGNLNQPRQLLVAAGTQTDALAFGGYFTSPLNSTELYNGTAWTTQPTMSISAYGRGPAGASSSSVIAFSGQISTPPYFTNATESYNGTSWTTPPATMNTARYSHAGIGTQTAALAAGGFQPPGDTSSNKSESYNGTSWTNAPNLNTARGYIAGSGRGTQTAAIVFGGGGGSAATESYNGTSWTTVNSLNTARKALGGTGTQTLALAFGGDPGSGTYVGATELWNGTSWTSNSTGLSTARGNVGSAGTQASALCAGGLPPTTAATEEWNSVATQTITVS
jgi:hypothetical protein